jgi:NAD(P)-dependent dehydrogenase (short-subunit alcohol dehydrogenase family)
MRKSLQYHRPSKLHDPNIMTFNQETTLALVTGASQGIGLEVSRQLAQRGMTVLLTGRNAEKTTNAANLLIAEGLNVIAKSLDVTSDDSVNALAAEVEREFGRLDVLVNNAATGFVFTETALNADMAAVNDTFETNFFGPWRMIRAFTPLLRKSAHPRIVNVGSGGGSFSAPEGMATNRRPSLPSYGTSKLALNGLTIKLAAELKDAGILVNSVCPGTTASHPGMEGIPGVRTVQVGAGSIVWAAVLPDDGPTGGFFRDGQPLAW